MLGLNKHIYCISAFTLTLARAATRSFTSNHRQLIIRCAATHRNQLIQSSLSSQKYISTKSAAPSVAQPEGKVKRFEADTHKLLEIVAKSLYSDKEVAFKF